MARHGDGSWTATAGGRDARYLYDVTVYAPTHARVETNLVTDPYSVALTPELDPVGGRRPRRPCATSRRSGGPRRRRSWRGPSTRRSTSCTCATSRSATRPCPRRTAAPTSRSPTTATAPGTCGPWPRPGSTPCTCCRRSTSPRSRRTARSRRRPTCDLASFPPDGEQQQACVEAVAAADGFNWGYDPLHCSAPEGSYASSTAAADGGCRVAEFRTMVGGAARGRAARRPRPGLQPHAGVRAGAEVRARPGGARLLPAARRRAARSYTSTCCQNVATEHAMAEKLMVDSVVPGRASYKVDGFRFDLMGHHSQANMLAVRAALDAADAAAGRGRRQVGLPLRRGLELRRGRRQRAVRAGHAGPARRHRASARSPTGCATRCAVAGRSTTTRASRASAPALATDPNGDAVNGYDPSRRHAGARHRPGAARAGRQPARRSRSAASTGRPVTRRRGRLQRRSRPGTPTSPTRSSPTSTPTTTRRCGTR